MRAALPAMLIPPMIFWACGSSNPPNMNGGPDAGARADATAARDAAYDGGAAAPDAELDAGEADSGTPPDAGRDEDTGVGEDTGAACAYPANPVEPMALHAVLFPYSWPEAINGAGDNFPLSLEAAHCDTDPNLAWSQFGHILFVSAPAW